jgi:hypothetical protein
VRRLVALALTGALLAGCVGDPSQTYVAPVTASDAVVLAAAVDTFVALSLRTRDRPVAIRAPQSEREIAPRLHELLTQEGYQVVDAGQVLDAGAPGAHRVSYAVTPFDKATLVRVYVDNERATRLYVRDAAGQLQPSGPYMAGEFRS